MKRNIFILLSILLVIGLIVTKNRYDSIKKAKLAREIFVKDSIAQFKADSIKAYIAAQPKRQYAKLEAGEGVFQVMTRMGISSPLTMRIINKLRFKAELYNLVVGEKFEAVYNPDSTKLIEFHYMPDIVTDHIIHIDTTTDSLTYSLLTKETTIKYKLVRGTIKANSTLNQALLDDGLSKGLTQTVNGILLCKVAFRREARVNDSFEVLIKEEFYKDTLIGDRSKVLYTKYNGSIAGIHEAYLYQDADPKSTYNAHYTKDGEALIFSGLRYPLDRLHVTSPYGWRVHPVTGKRRMHDGIDYGAPIGTNVYAVAPGTVVLSGYDKYSGNKIAIKHADGYRTYYLHLNRRLVSKGQVVRSHQLIGKVGKTGRVTGPHLHFGVKKPNGRWMNPNKKRMIATPKLKGDRLKALQEQVDVIDEIKDKMEKESDSSVVVEEF